MSTTHLRLSMYVKFVLNHCNTRFPLSKALHSSHTTDGNETHKLNFLIAEFPGMSFES